MSSLLEQAMVDAKALREAALKNAENAVIEKFTPQIKEAIEKMLEADEDPMSDPTDSAAGENVTSPEMDLMTSLEPGADDKGQGVVAGMAAKIPLAATDGEKLCACPEQEEEIEINFDELEKQMKIADQEQDMGQDDLAASLGMEPQPEPESPVMSQGQEDDQQLNLKEEIFEALKEEHVCETVHPETSHDDWQLKENTSLKQKTQLSESTVDFFKSSFNIPQDVAQKSAKILSSVLKNIQTSNISMDDMMDIRQMCVDKAMGIDSAEDNWNLDGKLTPAVEKAALMLQQMKEAQSTQYNLKESTNKLLNTSKVLLTEHQKLVETVNKKEEQIKILVEENQKFKSTLVELKESLDKLNDMNLTNSKLFYENQVLKSASLNERQKNKIVEAISKADSVNETKTIYETLVDSVGSSIDANNEPKSLQETLDRKKSIYRLRYKETETLPNNPMQDRWKKLAGIEKK